MANKVLTRRLAIIGLILCLAGIGVSTYLTVTHYNSSVTLACSESGLINCAKVTTSPYSSIHGVPLALLGLFFFIGMIAFQLPAAWRSHRWWVRWGRLGMSLSGVAMIFWLIYVELFILNAICLYCTAVHVLTLALFALSAVGTAITSRRPESALE